MESPHLNQWLAIGMSNPWIRHADDPSFSLQSFHQCVDDAELLEKFDRGNWCLGQAFYIGDLCFIQQSNGGDEWLTIKGDVAFESMSFGAIIKRRGREAAQAILDRIRQATPEQCRGLNYYPAGAAYGPPRN